ncbi:MAG TPA: FCD domain-containing protein [Candidatus Dormibacteraeota bacterium]|jgi:DNA-binding FadR family transcriptional regulator|nr:FCD domain-containing protein [Candidatus Dormibacteraeota bacterium]
MLKRRTTDTARRPAATSTKSTAKTAAKSPAKSAPKSPAKSAAKSPAKSAPKSAAKSAPKGAPRAGRPARDNGRAPSVPVPSSPAGYHPTVFITGRTEKKAEALARQILDDVIDSGLAPGSVLPAEATMLAQYRVGRTTLREAQRILEVHGLLDIRSGPGGGPVVTSATGRDYGRMSSLYYRAAGVRLHHLMEARTVMEPVTARLAAEHHTAEGIDRLAQLIGDLERKPESGDNRAFLSASREFHDVVTAISGNPIIDLFSQGLVNMFTDRMVGFVYPPDQRDEVNRQHIAIGRAILRGNGASAERLMREHMEEYNRHAWDGWSGSLNEVIAWR